MNSIEKSRQNFEAWWENYNKGKHGKKLAWQAWELGRGEGYQKGWRDAPRKTPENSKTIVKDVRKRNP